MSCDRQKMWCDWLGKQHRNVHESIEIMLWHLLQRNRAASQSALRYDWGDCDEKHVNENLLIFKDKYFTPMPNECMNQRSVG